MDKIYKTKKIATESTKIYMSGWEKAEKANSMLEIEKIAQFVDYNIDGFSERKAVEMVGCYCENNLLEIEKEWPGLIDDLYND